MGFLTLTLIGLAVLFSLASVTTVNVMDQMRHAFRTKAKTDIKAIDDAIKLFGIDHAGRYPTSLSELFPDGRAPYLAGRDSVDQLKDPWGTNYIYIPPTASSGYDIVSFGSDGGPGGVDEAADIHLADATQ